MINYHYNNLIFYYIDYNIDINLYIDYKFF